LDKYGGMLDRSMISIVEYHATKGMQMFPGYTAGILPMYFDMIEQTQQFRINRDEDGNLVSYSDYWLLDIPILKIKNKDWWKPWPRDISKGTYAYNYFTWINPKRKNKGLLKNLLQEFREDFPDKHLCYHILRHNNRFVHFEPHNSKLKLGVA